MRSVLRPVTLAIGIILLAGSCGKDSTSPSTGGTFSGTFFGDRIGTKSGFAHFFNTPVSFEIIGGTASHDFDFAFSASTAGLPTVGTHQIGYGVDEFYSSVFVDDFALAIDATRGAVTITSASAVLVTGSFSVTYADSDEEFTFTGTFSAKPCGAACQD